MSQWPHTVVLFCPVALQAQGNQLAAAIDPDTGGGLTFSAVRLSATGAEPATHLAAHTAARQSLIDMLTAAGNGAVDDPALLERFTAEQVLSVFSQLIVRVNVSFDAVLSDVGLRRIETDDET